MACFRKLLRLVLSFALIAMLIQASVAPRQAYALSRDTRTVIRAGTYGLVSGTVVGLAALPLTGSARGVFIGSSIGLYLGLIVGFYHITHRDDPENPLRDKLAREGPVNRPEFTPVVSKAPVRSPSLGVAYPVFQF